MADLSDFRHLLRGEVNSADAHLGVAFSLYLNGATAAYTLDADDRILIYSFQSVTAGAGRVVLAVDTDAAGKRLFAGTLAAGQILELNYLGVPLLCPNGVVPKLFAPAGQADASFWGRVLSKGRWIQ